MNGAQPATGPATEPEPATNVTVLVEALDERARQAGSEGAGTVLRGLVGSVAESLADLAVRLDRVEARVAALGEGGTVAQQVEQGLSAFNIRLGRLEEAFVQALDDSASGAEAVVAEVRSAVEAVVPPRETSVETALEMLRFQVSLLQDAVEREPPAVARTAVVEAAVDRLRADVLDAVRQEGEILNQRVAALTFAVDATRAALDRHVEESANTIGRRATEAGRKVASDIGLRGRRASADGDSAGD